MRQLIGYADFVSATSEFMEVVAALSRLSRVGGAFFWRGKTEHSLNLLTVFHLGISTRAILNRTAWNTR